MFDSLKRIKHKSDRDLMHILKAGDLEAFPILYSRYSKPVFKYVSRRIQPLHVAEEVTQDIFLKIFQHRMHYQDPHQVSSWIWTIVKNTVCDYFRTKKMGRFSLPIGLIEWEPILEETAETIMIRELDRRKLLEMMTSLSAPQKEAIFLRMVRRLSYQQISTTMNLSLSAVKSLLNRAKTTLRKQAYKH